MKCIKETEIIMNKLISFTYKKNEYYYEVDHLAGLIVYDSNKKRLLKSDPLYKQAYKKLSKIEKTNNK